MGHPIRGIRGAKPRIGPSIAQMMRAEELRKREKRKERYLRKSGVRKSAKPD
jgi:hypothetical protein